MLFSLKKIHKYSRIVSLYLQEREFKLSRKKELNDEQVAEDIYAAAVEVLEEYGLEGVSVRKVCDRAKISTGTFYNLYPSKQHLMTRLVDYMENYYKNDVVPFLNGTALEKLKQAAMAYITRIIRRGPRYARTNIDYTNNDRLTLDREQNLYRFQVFSQLAVEGVRNREISSGYSPDDVANAILSVCRGLSLTYTTLDGNIDILSLADKTFDMVIEGLKHSPVSDSTK